MTDPRRTEQVHPQYTNLDTLPTTELVQAFADDQLNAIQAVRQAAPAIAAYPERPINLVVPMPPGPMRSKEATLSGRSSARRRAAAPP